MKGSSEVEEYNPDHIISAIIDGFCTPSVLIQKSMFTKSWDFWDCWDIWAHISDRISLSNQFFYFGNTEDKVWNALLEKKGLHQEADVLEKYGIGSEIDVSELEQHDFSELESRVLTCKETEVLV